MFEGKSKAAFRTMDNILWQWPTQSIDEKLFRCAIQLPLPGNRDYRFCQLLIDQGNAQFQTLGHAHKIGVAQERIEHITTRLEIRNSIDGIKATRVVENISKGCHRCFQNRMIA